MNPGYEYALVTMMLLGLADLVYKRGAAAGVQPHQFLMVQAWCFAPAVTLYGLITGTLELDVAMLWGMGAGLFVFISLYNFARSLKSGSVSLVAPIFRLNFTVTAVLAVLVLGEPLTAYKLVGLALALAAVWLLLGAEAGAAPEAGAARLPLVQAVIAMAAMGVANLFYNACRMDTRGDGRGAIPAGPHTTVREPRARRRERAGADLADGIRRHRGVRPRVSKGAVHSAENRRARGRGRGARLPRAHLTWRVIK